VAAAKAGPAECVAAPAVAAARRPGGGQTGRAQAPRWANRPRIRLGLCGLCDLCGLCARAGARCAGCLVHRGRV